MSTYQNLELEWDEERGGPRAPEANISVPADGQFYKSTQHALPYDPPGDHDQDNDRMVVPVAFLEKLVRNAPVPDSEQLG